MPGAFSNVPQNLAANSLSLLGPAAEETCHGVEFCTLPPCPVQAHQFESKWVKFGLVPNLEEEAKSQSLRGYVADRTQNPKDEKSKTLSGNGRASRKGDAGCQTQRVRLRVPCTPPQQNPHPQMLTGEMLVEKHKKNQKEKAISRAWARAGRVRGLGAQEAGRAPSTQGASSLSLFWAADSSWHQPRTPPRTHSKVTLRSQEL